MFRAILVVLLVLWSAQAVYCQSFEAIGVSEDLQEAILKSTVTGEERIVRRGDTIDGWRVVEIAPTHVTIGRQVEGGGAIATRVPVRVKLRPRTERP